MSQLHDKQQYAVQSGTINQAIKPLPKDSQSDKAQQAMTRVRPHLKKAVIMNDKRPMQDRNSLQYTERLQRLGIVSDEDQARRAAEEYRRIKRPLIQNAVGKNAAIVQNGRMIMVTSSIPNEGKTYTAVNLALSIAREKDNTVLLVDGDTAKASATSLMGLLDKPGLTDVLLEDKDIGEVLYRTDIPDLSIMPAGASHTQVAELYSSQRMREVVEELSQRYADRIIIFDSPPLTATAEAPVLADLVGQVVMVVEALSTPKKVINEALAMLDRSKPINLVLNKNQLGSGADYYDGYYGYGR